MVNTFLEYSGGLKIRNLSVSFNQEPLDGQRYVPVFKKLSLGQGSLDRTISRYLVISMSRDSLVEFVQLSPDLGE